MYCSKCGKELKDGVKFCKYCGYNLEEEDLCSLGKEDAGNGVTADGENGVLLDQSVKEDAYKENAESPENSGAEGVKEAECEGSADAAPKRRRRRRKGEREIEDKRQLEKYTIKEENAVSAPLIDESRIQLIKKGKIRKLKAVEITSIVIAGLVMALSAIVLGVIKAGNRGEDEAMTWLVIATYMLFFAIFLSLAFGIDRLYNLLTLNELNVRKITVKKFGWAMRPLVLRGEDVYAVEIIGECELCEEGVKGTYHVERVGDSLIAVCGFNREHIFRIDEKKLTEFDVNEI
jgi:hypothetical protein